MNCKRCLRIIDSQPTGRTGERRYQTEDGRWWEKLGYYAVNADQTWSPVVGKKINGSICFPSTSNTTS